MPLENRPIRVLLIEDNSEHAELLERLLGFSDYPKFAVTTGRTLAAGLKKLGAGTQDIVLLDLTLSDSDGVETFRRVNAASPALPIVILSGISDVTSAIEMVQEGAQDYLVKGHVDTHLLLRSIQYAIERKRSQVAMQNVNAELESRVTERTAALVAVNEQLQREVAERRRAEEQLVKSNRQLTVALAELRAAQRGKALSERSGAATRELEDSFKRIQQHSELILHAPAVIANPEKVTEHLQQIVAAVEAGRKGLRKPREIPEEAAPEEPAAPAIQFETVALDALAERVIALCSPKAGDQARTAAAKVTFVRQADKGVEIQGDPVQLREMLTHLVRNSMAAIPRRGTITVGAQRQGSEAILFVQDDGLGVSEAVRQRLLDPSASTDRADGWPSGYAVIHEVVARHRGRLEVESRKGIGTTVRIIFPSAKSTNASARKRRVLVVDDDAMVREVISAYLSEDGYAVELAMNGREGLEKFAAGQFDIVLTDRSMPEMEGDELAREVKKIKPDVPVILLTGFGDIMAVTGEKPAGVDVVMSKPFTMAGLQNTLANFR
jgi:DNA-binding response OmpR family regulator